MSIELIARLTNQSNSIKRLMFDCQKQSNIENVVNFDWPLVFDWVRSNENSGKVRLMFEYVWQSNIGFGWFWYYDWKFSIDFVRLTWPSDVNQIFRLSNTSIKIQLNYCLITVWWLPNELRKQQKETWKFR